MRSSRPCRCPTAQGYQDRSSRVGATPPRRAVHPGVGPARTYSSSPRARNVNAALAAQPRSSGASPAPGNIQGPAAGPPGQRREVALSPAFASALSASATPARSSTPAGGSPRDVPSFGRVPSPAAFAGAQYGAHVATTRRADELATTRPLDDLEERLKTALSTLSRQESAAFQEADRLAELAGRSAEFRPDASEQRQSCLERRMLAVDLDGVDVDSPRVSARVVQPAGAPSGQRSQPSPQEVPRSGLSGGDVPSDIEHRIAREFAAQAAVVAELNQRMARVEQRGIVGTKHSDVGSMVEAMNKLAGRVASLESVGLEIPWHERIITLTDMLEGVFNRVARIEETLRSQDVLDVPTLTSDLDRLTAEIEERRKFHSLVQEPKASSAALESKADADWHSEFETRLRSVEDLGKRMVVLEGSGQMDVRTLAADVEAQTDEMAKIVQRTMRVEKRTAALEELCAYACDYTKCKDSKESAFELKKRVDFLEDRICAWSSRSELAAESIASWSNRADLTKESIADLLARMQFLEAKVSEISDTDHRQKAVQSTAQLQARTHALEEQLSAIGDTDFLKAAMQTTAQLHARTHALEEQLSAIGDTDSLKAAMQTMAQLQVRTHTLEEQLSAIGDIDSLKASMRTTAQLRARAQALEEHVFSSGYTDSFENVVQTMRNLQTQTQKLEERVSSIGDAASLQNAVRTVVHLSSRTQSLESSLSSIGDIASLSVAVQAIAKLQARTQTLEEQLSSLGDSEPMRQAVHAIDKVQARMHSLEEQVSSLGDSEPIKQAVHTIDKVQARMHALEEQVSSIRDPEPMRQAVQTIMQVQARMHALEEQVSSIGDPEAMNQAVQTIAKLQARTCALEDRASSFGEGDSLNLTLQATSHLQARTQGLEDHLSTLVDSLKMALEAITPLQVRTQALEDQSRDSGSLNITVEAMSHLQARTQNLEDHLSSLGDSLKASVDAIAHLQARAQNLEDYSSSIGDAESVVTAVTAMAGVQSRTHVLEQQLSKLGGADSLKTCVDAIAHLEARMQSVEDHGKSVAMSVGAVADVQSRTHALEKQLSSLGDADSLRLAVHAIEDLQSRTQALENRVSSLGDGRSVAVAVDAMADVQSRAVDAMAEAQSRTHALEEQLSALDCADSLRMTVQAMEQLQARAQALEDSCSSVGGIDSLQTALRTVAGLQARTQTLEEKISLFGDTDSLTVAVRTMANLQGRMQSLEEKFDSLGDTESLKKSVQTVTNLQARTQTLENNLVSICNTESQQLAEQAITHLQRRTKSLEEKVTLIGDTESLKTVVQDMVHLQARTQTLEEVVSSIGDADAVKIAVQDIVLLQARTQTLEDNLSSFGDADAVRIALRDMVHLQARTQTLEDQLSSIDLQELLGARARREMEEAIAAIEAELHLGMERFESMAAFSDDVQSRMSVVENLVESRLSGMDQALQDERPGLDRSEDQSANVQSKIAVMENVFESRVSVVEDGLEHHIAEHAREQAELRSGIQALETRVAFLHAMRSEVDDIKQRTRAVEGNVQFSDFADVQAKVSVLEKMIEARDADSRDEQERENRRDSITKIHSELREGIELCYEKVASVDDLPGELSELKQRVCALEDSFPCREFADVQSKLAMMESIVSENAREERHTSEGVNDQVEEALAALRAELHSGMQAFETRAAFFDDVRLTVDDVKRRLRALEDINPSKELSDLGSKLLVMEKSMEDLALAMPSRSHDADARPESLECRFKDVETQPENLSSAVEGIRRASGFGNDLLPKDVSDLRSQLASLEKTVEDHSRAMDSRPRDLDSYTDMPDLRSKVSSLETAVEDLARAMASLPRGLDVRPEAFECRFRDVQKQLESLSSAMEGLRRSNASEGVDPTQGMLDLRSKFCGLEKIVQDLGNAVAARPGDSEARPPTFEYRCEGVEARLMALSSAIEEISRAGEHGSPPWPKDMADFRLKHSDLEKTVEDLARMVASLAGDLNARPNVCECRCKELRAQVERLSHTVDCIHRGGALESKGISELGFTASVLEGSGEDNVSSIASGFLASDTPTHAPEVADAFDDKVVEREGQVRVAGVEDVPGAPGARELRSKLQFAEARQQNELTADPDVVTLRHVELDGGRMQRKHSVIDAADVRSRVKAFEKKFQHGDASNHRRLGQDRTPEELAALKIQAIHRGNIARRQQSNNAFKSPEVSCRGSASVGKAVPKHDAQEGAAGSERAVPKGAAGIRMVQEKRKDPEDGKLWALEDFVAAKMSEFDVEEIKEYWDTEMLPVRERRVDPEDGKTWVFEDFIEANRLRFDVEEISEYWDTEMTPAPDPDLPEPRARTSLRMQVVQRGKSGRMREDGSRKEETVTESTLTDALPQLTAHETRETRVDPEDGRAWVFQDFLVAKQSDFDIEEIWEYWDGEMMPVSDYADRGSLETRRTGPAAAIHAAPKISALPDVAAGD